MKAITVKFILGLAALLAPMSVLAAVTFSGPTWYEYRDASLVTNGKGTLLDPIVIGTPEQLAQLSWMVNEQRNTFDGKVVVLAADIDLSKEAGGKRVEWVPIGLRGDFRGVFLGIDTREAIAGATRHTVKGMYMNVTLSGSQGSANKLGLFGICTGFVGYVDIREASLTARSSGSRWEKPGCTAGLLCGAVYNTQNVTFTEEDSGDGNTLSILPGITAASVEGTLTVDGGEQSFIGGICGQVAAGELAHSTAKVSITNNGIGQGIGGIAGAIGIESAEIESSIIDCVADARLSFSKATHTAGGVAGTAYYATSVKGCSSTGTISGRLPSAVGGIVGQQDYKADVLACSSTVSFENTDAGSPVYYLGGITGRLGQSDNAMTTVEGCVYAGHIDGTNAFNVGGICGSYEGAKDQHVTNCLFLGTMKRSALPDAHCGAIVGLSPKPIETVVGCYYDRQLFSGDAVGGFSTVTTIFGLSTRELTSGNMAAVPMLPDEGGEDYGFALNDGYYPMLLFNGKGSGDSLPEANSPGSEIGHRLFGSNRNSENSVAKPSAWLASVPAVIRYGDCADDFVSTVSVSEYRSQWTDHVTTGPPTTVSVQSEVLFPDAACVTVDEQTATAKAQGSCVLSINCLASATDMPADRPKAIGATKCLWLNVTLGTLWDGTTAKQCAAGTGSAEDPFIIKNGAQLYYAVNNNKAGEFYEQICDIRLNETDTESNGTVRFGKSWDVTGDWHASYDGGGHFVRGASMAGTNTPRALFGNITPTGSVTSLGLVETTLNGKVAGLAYNMDGKISNCLVHGNYMTLPGSVGPDGRYDHGHAGGICYAVGPNNPDAVVEDCATAMFGASFLSDYTPFVCLSAANRGVVRNCLAVVPTAFADLHFENRESFSAAGHSFIQDCYWLKGYEAGDNGSTLEEISSALATRSLWKTNKGYFPMLKSFADTDLGKLLAIPVRTDVDYDPASSHLIGFSRHLTFEPGMATWSSTDTGESFFESDGDLGIVVPVKASYVIGAEMHNYKQRQISGLYYLRAEYGGSVIFIPVCSSDSDVKPGISFVDDNAHRACLDAFDTDANGHLSLAELKAVTTEQTLTAFQTPTARRIKEFPEFCFFKSVAELTSQLNGLSSLESVSLPYSLRTIGAEAFKGCGSLKQVTVASKVAEVKPRAFHTSVVENILVDPFNEQFTSRDGVLFTQDDELVCYPNGRTGEEAVIEGTVRRIAEGAFYMVPGLRRIYLDNNNFNTVPRLSAGSLVTDAADAAMMHVYVSDATYDETLMRKYRANSSWANYEKAGHLHRYFPLKVPAGLTWRSTGAAPATTASETLYLTTMCIGFDTRLPEGLTPYIVERADRVNYEATLTRKDSEVPATAAVVIVARRPGVYRLYPVDYAEGPLEPWPLYENRLVGTDRYGRTLNQSTAAQGSILTLGYPDPNAAQTAALGFYPDKTKSVPPYHAYLPYNTVGMDPDIAANAHYDIVFTSNAADIALVDMADNSELLTKYDGQLVNVTYDRVLRAIDNGDGTWTSRAYTVCLPYDCRLVNTVEQTGWAQTYCLRSVTDNYEFVFTNEFNYISAGIPTVVVVNKGEFRLDAKNVVLTNKTAEDEYINKIYDDFHDVYAAESSQVGWWRGTFRTISNDEGSAMHAFVMSTDGKWRVIRNDQEKYRTGYLPPFRAYFQPLVHKNNHVYTPKFIYTEPGGNDINEMEDFPADTFDSVMQPYDDDSETDAVEPLLHTIDRDGTHRYFDLQGRPLEHRPDKGIYIEQGRKTAAAKH